MAGNGGLSLQCTDRPKTALDEQIDQLVLGAERARSTQRRLRELVSACAHVAGALEVDVVLRNLAESAAGLTDAAQAAVVVHGTDAAWTEVVHTGLTDDQFELVRSRGTVPASNGTLCHPLTLDREPYGELHLFDSAHGAFSPEDGELVRALALTAETALSHARLYDESQRQQDWLRANARIIQQTLSSDGEDPLAVVARVAAGLADADLVTVSLLTEDGTELVVEAGSGQRVEEYVGQRFAVEGTPSGAALATGTPLPVMDYRALGIDVHTISSDFDAGPVMLVPLVGGQRTWGLMSVVRTRGRPVFSPEDLAMASDFANHATISLELAEARDAEQRMQVLEDRERIARDLHDHVIQELFAIGIGITNSAEATNVPEGVRRRLHDRVGDLDRTIRRVRTSIFALCGTLDRTRDELRSGLLDVATELTPVLGFSPAVQFSGAPGAIAEDLVEDATAVVREALTNVARHAHADSASVELIATPERLAVVVTDDGVGIGDSERRGGTKNLRARAERHRGTCTVVSGPVRGTVLTWEIGLT